MIVIVWYHRRNKTGMRKIFINYKKYKIYYDLLDPVANYYLYPT